MVWYLFKSNFHLQSVIENWCVNLTKIHDLVGHPPLSIHLELATQVKIQQHRFHDAKAHVIG